MFIVTVKDGFIACSLCSSVKEVEEVQRRYGQTSVQEIENTSEALMKALEGVKDGFTSRRI